VNCSDWADCKIEEFGDTDTMIPASGFSGIRPETEKVLYGAEHAVAARAGTEVPVGAVPVGAVPTPPTPLHADSRNKDQKEQTESRNRMNVL
jgi:hypothetical protein